MHKLVVLPVAERRFKESYKWYLERSPEAAEKFALAVTDVLNKLRHSKTNHAYFRKPIRKVKVKKYPFLVLHELIDDTLLVHNIFHTKRNPRSWRR